MAKDALGHGSDGRDAQGFDANGERPARSGAPNRWDTKGTPIAELQAARARYAATNGEAANSLASGPKSAPVSVHDSMIDSSTHNDQGHAWGSPEALKDFRDKYNVGRAAGRAKNMEDFGFRSGKREINSLRKRGK